MARRTGGRGPGKLSAGALVLDRQGLALGVEGDPVVGAQLEHARTHDIEVVVSTLTLVEAMNPQRLQPRWHYVISKIRIEEVTRQLSDQAVVLLRSAGLHGHTYAIDAVVAATAMAQHGPTMLLTSDLDDMAKLCDKRIMLVPV
ncbi:hypothetical protein ACFWA9_36135 [Kitasatospora sp. NPDC059973]|uniref:hypothetical protein n=1 Tax=Kitasatospora sp. NPDC059973 TaxID=3347020 RepID=UPI00368147F8